MKNLANCTPTEFMKQTYIIKKDLEKWIEHTGIKDIRARKPELLSVPIEATAEEKQKIIEKNKALIREQGLKNFSEILDVAMEKYPDETLRILALLCFVDPAEIDSHPMSEYINCVAERIQDEAVINFFISFYRWGQTNILNA